MALGLAPQAADPPSLTVATSSLIAVLGLVAINGFFVAAEFSLVAARRSKLDEMVAKGDWGAKAVQRDRKSTRLNSSHRCISYAVFCLKKKKTRVTDAS